MDLYVDGLRRSQLQLAGLAVVALIGLVAALPLLALVLPGIGGATVRQVPLIALLPLLPFPAFLLVGMLQRRRADGLDRGFSALVDPQEDEPGRSADHGPGA